MNVDTEPGFRTGPERSARTFVWVITGTVCICLAISALYELIEWWTALAPGHGAQAFLGTQGNPWDTQWDMFCALIGACVSLLALSRLYDCQIRGMTEAIPAPSIR